MGILADRRALSLLSLLLAGTIANSMIVPFMPYYIVEGLGEEPWKISLYSGFVVILTVVFNRQFGKRIDEGARFFPLIVGSGVAFVSASAVSYLFPNYWVLLAVSALGFSLSGTFMALMFTLGRQFADGAAINSGHFNAYLRGTTSTAWMIGPAISFTLADAFGVRQVFIAALLLGFVRIIVTVFAVPRGLAGVKSPPPAGEGYAQPLNRQLWQAVAACFLLSLAHSLCFVALPLFYTREVGLPDFAPGLAFSVKTATEIGVIASTPFLMKRFSKRIILLAASLLALVAIFALSRVATLQMMVFVQILEGAYYGLYASVGVSFVQSFARGRMGHATSLYVNTLMISGIVAGPAVGVIGQFFSFQTAIELSLVAVLMAIGAFYLVRENKEEPEEETG